MLSCPDTEETVICVLTWLHNKQNMLEDGETLRTKRMSVKPQTCLPSILPHGSIQGFPQTVLCGCIKASHRLCCVDPSRLPAVSAVSTGGTGTDQLLHGVNTAGLWHYSG